MNYEKLWDELKEFLRIEWDETNKELDIRLEIAQVLEKMLAMELEQVQVEIEQGREEFRLQRNEIS